MPVHEVASQVGYGNDKYFSMLFKNYRSNAELVPGTEQTGYGVRDCNFIFPANQATVVVRCLLLNMNGNLPSMSSKVWGMLDFDGTDSFDLALASQSVAFFDFFWIQAPLFGQTGLGQIFDSLHHHAAAPEVPLLQKSSSPPHSARPDQAPSCQEQAPRAANLTACKFNDRIRYGFHHLFRAGIEALSPLSPPFSSSRI